MRRVSGPILDRFDLTVEVPPIEPRDYFENGRPANAGRLREQVVRARDRQRKRLKDCGLTVNSQMGLREIERFCVLGEPARALLISAAERNNLSARALTRILRVARSVADLKEDEAEQITREDLAFALSCRFALPGLE
jgi:magnesium chelatase family protein